MLAPVISSADERGRYTTTCVLTVVRPVPYQGELPLVEPSAKEMAAPLPVARSRLRSSQFRGTRHLLIPDVSHPSRVLSSGTRWHEHRVCRPGPLDCSARHIRSGSRMRLDHSAFRLQGYPVGLC